MDNYLLIGIIIVIISIAGWLAYLSYRFFNYIKEKEELLKKAKNQSVEALLEKSLDENEKAQADIKKIKETVDNLGKVAMISLTKVGVVRFNPFQDTGGDQSFAFALLNAKGDGIVISSLHGREGTRIYAKPIKELKSEYHLTEEEIKAIEKAQG